MKVAMSMKELQRVAKPPMVVLATNDAMEDSFSKQLLDQWCGDPRNMILFTSRPHPNSIGGRLLQLQHNSARLFKYQVSTDSVQFSLQCNVDVREDGFETHNFSCNVTDPRSRSLVLLRFYSADCCTFVCVCC